MAEIKQVTIDTTEYKPRKVKVDVWQATDGKQFPLKDKAKAEKYQADVDLANRRAEIYASIKKVDLNKAEFFDGGEWYLAENEEQLEWIRDTLGWKSGHSYHYVNGKDRSPTNTLKVGDWITCQYEDGGDYSRDTYRWYTFDAVLADMMIILELAKKAGMINYV